MNQEGCEYGKANRDRLNWFIEEWDNWKNNDFKHFQDHVYKKIDKLKDSFTNRPSWSLFLVIIILSNITVGLIIFIVTNK